jgi:hypothetical protein
VGNLGPRTQGLGTRGAFHLTEIPKILLKNQMEHVNYWNDVSDNFEQSLEVVHKLEIPEVSKFLHAIKTFPNHVAVFQSSTSKNRHQNQNGGFLTISVPRVWIYFAEC